MDWKSYKENRVQEDMASKAIMKLYYQCKIPPDVVANMNISELNKLLEKFQIVDPTEISPIRFAAMVKLAARMSVNKFEINPITPEDE